MRQAYSRTQIISHFWRILWLLTPRTRELLRQLDDANDARIRAEDGQHAAQAECDRWHDEYVRKDQECSRAYQMATNVAWQRMYGVKPYPDAPGIPEGRSTAERAGPTENPVAAAAAARNKAFKEQGLRYYEEAHKTAGANGG